MSDSSVAIQFGRFNPPHLGHKAAWEKASKYENWFVGTNKQTHGPKDPLPYDIKIIAMETVYPDIKGHIVGTQSWLSLANYVYENYKYDDLIIISDNAVYYNLIKQYNAQGKPGDTGYYNFKNVIFDESERLSSSTSLRDAVVANDRDAFTAAAGVSAETPIGTDKTPFFDLVAEYLLPLVKKKKKISLNEITSQLDPSKWILRLKPTELYENMNYSVFGLIGPDGTEYYPDNTDETHEDIVLRLKLGNYTRMLNKQGYIRWFKERRNNALDFNFDVPGKFPTPQQIQSIKNIVHQFPDADEYIFGYIKIFVTGYKHIDLVDSNSRRFSTKLDAIGKTDLDEEFTKVDLNEDSPNYSVFGLIGPDGTEYYPDNTDETHEDIVRRLKLGGGRYFTVLGQGYIRWFKERMFSAVQFNLNLSRKTDLRLFPTSEQIKSIKDIIRNFRDVDEYRFEYMDKFGKIKELVDSSVMKFSTKLDAIIAKH